MEDLFDMANLNHGKPLLNRLGIPNHLELLREMQVTRSRMMEDHLIHPRSCFLVPKPNPPPSHSVQVMKMSMLLPFTMLATIGT
jgi:hypothetical protein